MATLRTDLGDHHEGPIRQNGYMIRSWRSSEVDGQCTGAVVLTVRVSAGREAAQSIEPHVFDRFHDFRHRSYCVGRDAVEAHYPALSAVKVLLRSDKRPDQGGRMRFRAQECRALGSVHDEITSIYGFGPDA